MTDFPALIPGTATPSGPSSPKRQRTSTESNFAPSEARLSPGPHQIAYEITRQILDEAGAYRDSAPEVPPAVSIALAREPQDPAGGEQSPNALMVNDESPALDFEMWKSGISGPSASSPLPSVASPYRDTAATADASSPAPAAAGAAKEGAARQIAHSESPARAAIAESTNTEVPAEVQRMDSPGRSRKTRPYARRPSGVAKSGPSLPTSAAGLNAEVAKTASPQSLAMKRKWASGKMDHVAKKAAETRRQNAEQRLIANGKRRMSVISISDSSTPESTVSVSTPVPAPAAVAQKPSLAEFYRKRVEQAAATTSSPESSAAVAASDIASPPAPTDVGSAIHAIAKTRTMRPTILPPKKRARQTVDVDPTQEPGTPYARSLTGRPYDMVPNEKGRHIHGFGALFPDGYVPFPDPDGKGPRWICPLENCTHERTYLKSHGKHFTVNHRACLLNDNGDGTFTVVGYNMEQNAPVVVSRNAKGKPAVDTTPADSTTETGEAKDSIADADSMRLDDATSQQQSAAGSDLTGPFIFTPSGRPYTSYPDISGRKFGVPIPDGYERLVTSAEKPWVCPVVPCLSSWASQNGLSIHFGRKHAGSILNDNLDGTLSVLGQRDNDPRYQAVQGWDRKDALIVRQGPMRSVAQPGARARAADSPQPDIAASGSHDEHDTSSTPRLPSSTDLSVLHTPASHLKTHYLIPAANAQPVKDLNGDALQTWNYIRTFLTEFEECPDASWIPELLKLPKVRDIVWDNAYIAAHGFKDRLARDVATMILQVTGEAPPKPCSRCRDGKGPYGECIAISSEAPVDARLAFASCASCIYNGQGTYCTAKFWGKKRALDAAAEMSAAAATQRVLDDTDGTSMSLPNGGQAASSGRRSARVQAKESTAQSGSERQDSIVATIMEEAAPFTHHEEASPQPSSPPLSLPPTSQSALRRLTRTSNHRSEPQTDLQPTGTANMEMEEWELAPGRLQSAAIPDDGDLPETIAFSQPYLTANLTVLAAQDTTFRVDVVRPGSSVRFAPMPDRVRICSVGAGKVKVRMLGEDEFDIGPHGMFRVLRGRSCVVLNRLYGDAVLHVTEVPDYG